MSEKKKKNRPVTNRRWITLGLLLALLVVYACYLLPGIIIGHEVARSMTMTEAFFPTERAIIATRTAEYWQTRTPLPHPTQTQED